MEEPTMMISQTEDGRRTKAKGRRQWLTCEDPKAAAGHVTRRKTAIRIRESEAVRVDKPIVNLV